MFAVIEWLLDGTEDAAVQPKQTEEFLLVEDAETLERLRETREPRRADTHGDQGRLNRGL